MRQTKALFTATVLAALCCTATSVFAEGPDELWEVTKKMEMAGMPSMLAQTNKTCKRKGDRSPDLDKTDNRSDCRTTDVETSGAKTTWKVVRTKPDPMTGTGEMTHTGDKFDGAVKMSGKMQGEPFEMNQVLSGRKVGSCTYEDPGKKVKEVQSQSQAMIAKECDKQIESLNPMMVFGGANLPPESLYCKDRKADFCAHAAKVAQQMREPAGFSAASRKYPEWRDANNLGYAYQQAGHVAEARLVYQQAIELDPDYWKARINLDVLESAQQR